MDPIALAYTKQANVNKQMEVVANNIANADTNGFKEDLVLFLADKRRGATQISSFKVANDKSQGALKFTGRNLDVAINGDGYFQVQTSDGVKYSRNGHFNINPEGQLVTVDGFPVLGDGGAIAFEPSDRNIEFTQNGEIYAVNSGFRQLKATLNVTKFDDNNALEKISSNLFVASATGRPAVNGEDYQLVSNSLEGSNVERVSQVTALVDITRAAKQVSKIMSDLDQQQRNAINKIAGK